MDVVIAGGSGQLGSILRRAFTARGDRVTVLGRGEDGEGRLRWDGRSLGPWVS